jgi:hypothetical protein
VKVFVGGSPAWAPLVRWVATEAVAHYHAGRAIPPPYRRIAEWRGNKVFRVAAARKFLTLVFSGMRDATSTASNGTPSDGQAQSRRDLAEGRDPTPVGWSSGHLP